jgi:FKBP-type peptidyl-prolyl cis-trans isomerase FklB
MKKTILMALLIIASATVTTATAGKKDKKKKGTTTAIQPVQLNSGIDSLSYALGMSQSQGLKKYLANQLKVDTTYIDAFCEGLIEVANQPITDEESARYAGHSIGLQVVKSMIPTMETEIKAADESMAINRNAFLSAFPGA